MATASVETIADIVIPDTALVREVTASSAKLRMTCCSITPGGCSCSARCRVVAGDCSRTWSCSMSGRCFTTSG